MPDPHGTREAPQSVTRREVLALLAALPAARVAASEPRRLRHHLLVWNGWVIRTDDLKLIAPT